MDQLEIICQAEQTPELFLGQDFAEWAHPLRVTAGIGTPPWPRDVEQRFRGQIADERLVRRIRHRLRVRAQVLLHRRQKRRLALTSPAGELAHRLRAVSHQPRRVDKDTCHALDDDRHRLITLRPARTAPPREELRRSAMPWTDLLAERLFTCGLRDAQWSTETQGLTPGDSPLPSPGCRSGPSWRGALD